MTSGFSLPETTRVIIFDFDGVILDSVPIKTEGFRLLFDGYPVDYVDKLVEFHKANGGMSRYKKIKYFFNSILGESISTERISELANKFSRITLEELKKESYRIDDTISFIKNNVDRFDMHIASGSDENDLIKLCASHNLINYFKSISGSPKVKTEIVSDIIKEYAYICEEVILIGDAVNDFEASQNNGIKFFGYNNILLKQEDFNYIDSMS